MYCEGWQNWQLHRSLSFQMRYVYVVYKLHTTLGDEGQYNKRLTQGIVLSRVKP